MGEVVNALVAFAVIVFIFRWATSGMCLCSFTQSQIRPWFGFVLLRLLHVILSLSNANALARAGNDSTERRSAAETLGFRPKPVTQDMVCFRLYLPHIPDVYEHRFRLTPYRTCSQISLCKPSLCATFSDLADIIFFETFV